MEQPDYKYKRGNEYLEHPDFAGEYKYKRGNEYLEPPNYKYKRGNEYLERIDAPPLPAILNIFVYQTKDRVEVLM